MKLSDLVNNEQQNTQTDQYCNMVDKIMKQISQDPTTERQLYQQAMQFLVLTLQQAKQQLRQTEQKLEKTQKKLELAEQQIQQNKQTMIIKEQIRNKNLDSKHQNENQFRLENQTDKQQHVSYYNSPGITIYNQVKLQQIKQQNNSDQFVIQRSCRKVSVMKDGVKKKIQLFQKQKPIKIQEKKCIKVEHNVKDQDQIEEKKVGKIRNRDKFCSCGNGYSVFSRNMCCNCYQKFGRTAKVTRCIHVYEALYADGVCNKCYQAKNKKINKQKIEANNLKNKSELKEEFIKLQDINKVSKQVKKSKKEFKDFDITPQEFCQ